MQLWQVVTRQTMRVGAIGLTALLLLLDVASDALLAACSGAVMAVIALHGGDLRRRVALALGLTLAVSAVSAVTATGTGAAPGTASFGLAEAAGLGLLLVLATRLLPVGTARWAVPTLSVAVLLLPQRLGTDAGSESGLTFVLAVCVAMAVALGGLLRAQDSDRAAALGRARSDERLSLARDLHDSVAHHVTGIVVRAQAAQVVAARDPADAVAALAEIEREGLDTLTSMRRLVGVLRDHEGERQPPPGLAQIRDLVARFAADGPPADVVASPEAAGADLPDEVGTAAHRVVQEALTNVRRHARRPTAVAVELDLLDGALQIRVRDDGGDHRSSGAGGFGLAGLRERVHALGGDMTAGPMAGGGWEVAASLPLDGTAARPAPLPTSDPPPRRTAASHDPAAGTAP